MAKQTYFLEIGVFVQKDAHNLIKSSFGVNVLEYEPRDLAFMLISIFIRNRFFKNVAACM